MAARILKGPELKYKPEETCLGQFLFNMAGKNDDRICQIDAITGEEENFNSVKVRSVRVALQMREKGITSEDIVVLCSRNTLDCSIPVLAALFLGAKVASLDPTLSIRDTKHLISLVKPTMIFVEKESLKLIEDCLGDRKEFEPEVVVFGESSEYLSFNDSQKPSKVENSFRPVEVDTHETAFIFFSSGTTGLPKAICLHHKYFLDYPEMLFESREIYAALLYFTTMYWISAAYMLMASFSCGGYRVLMPYSDAELTFKVIEKYKITYMVAAPSITYPLANLKTAHNYDTSSLQVFGIGGSSISHDQMERVRKLFPRTTTSISYGMTEVGLVTIFDIGKHKDLIASKPVSCGKVCPATSVKIVDPETNRVLGPNQEGEIRVKSDRLMVGYYNMDSSDCFDQDGFLKTGDIGYYDEDECFYVVERIKEMFKYQSWHIIPSIIEGVLLEHPQVSDAVVFGIPHEEYGDVPTASVVLKENANTTSEQIADFVAKRVSDREKLRAGVFIVDCIPKTPTGKVIRRKARDDIMKLLKLSNE